MLVQRHVRLLYSVDWGHLTISAAMDRTEILEVIKSWNGWQTSRFLLIFMKPRGKALWLILNLLPKCYRNRWESGGLPSLSRLDHRVNLCSFHCRNGEGDLSQRCTTGEHGAGPTSHVNFLSSQKIIRVCAKKWEISDISFMVGIRTFRKTLVFCSNGGNTNRIRIRCNKLCTSNLRLNLDVLYLTCHRRQAHEINLFAFAFPCSGVTCSLIISAKVSGA